MGPAGRLVLAACGLALLAGCAEHLVRGEMRLRDATGVGEGGLAWPAPPEVPRYAYIGTLTGENNFRDRPRDEGTGARVLAFLLGVFEAQRQVVTLQRPLTGVTDREGRIYVTDVSRAAVFAFDPVAGQLDVWERADGLVRFVSPAGIALGADDEILVADAELGLVSRLNRKGEPVGAFGKDALKRPTGLARDPDRRLVYVTDTHGHDIKVFDDRGGLIGVIGRRGDGPGEFNYPTHIAFANGELYVTDTFNNRIQVLDGDGNYLRGFGERGLYVGNLVRPKGVAVDEEGNIYVVESYYDHLLVFNSQGQFLMSLGGTGTEPGKFYLPAGIWVDGRNRVYISDMFNGRVSIFQFLGGS